MKVKKKTLRKMSRALAFMMAVVIVLTSLGLDSLVVNAADPVEPGATASVESVLGEAINYGLVANDITFVGHLESNFAVKTIHHDAQMNDKNANGPRNDGFVGDIIFANYEGVEEGKGLLYAPNNQNTGNGTIYTTADAVKYLRNPDMVRYENGKYVYSRSQTGVSLTLDYEKYSKSDLEGKIDSMINAVKSQSSTLFSENHQINYSTSYGQVIDFTPYGAGTYYIKFANSDDFKSLFKSDESVIKINGNQNVVINIDGEKVELSKYKLVVDGKKYSSDGYQTIMTEKVIINCPNAKSVVFEGSVDAVVLVPNATVNMNDVSAGYMVADNFANIGGKEWHLLTKLPTPGNTTPDAKTADVFFAKVDADDASKKLSGAVFTIYDAQGSEIKTATSDDNGLVEFKGLEAGKKYTIKETTAPANYIKLKDTDVINVAIDADGTVTLSGAIDTTGETPIVKNSISKGTTTVSFRKVNEDLTNPSPLKDASFALYSDANCTSQVGTTVTTGTDGIVSFDNVSYSRENATVYYIKETSAPDGYVAYPNVIKVTVGTDAKATFDSGVDAKGDLSNSLLTTSIEFIKVDKNDNAGLNGAEFKLYSDADCTKVLATTTSQAVDSKNGVVKFANIKYSQNNITTYYIKETKAPDGYMGISDVITATVDTKGIVSLSKPVIDGKFENEKIQNPTSVTFTKVDENGNGLAGAEFEIFSDADCTQSKGTATSDINGVVTFDNLSYAKNADTKYYIKETKAPDFYQPLNSIITVTIDKSNVASFSAPVVGGKVVNNPLVKSEFKFVKMNEKGAPLKDVEFKLEGNGYSQTAVSDADGIVIFENIPYSLNKNTEYTLSETKAPAGYKAVENKTITVDTDGVLHLPGFKIQPNVTPMLTNEENMGDSAKVEFTKVDFYNKTKVVPGATFQLYNEADYPVGDAVTSDSNGKVVFDKLTYSTVPNNTTKYTIRETKTPAGYIESGAVINVSIDSRGTVTITGANVDGAKVTNTPITGSLKITKTIEGDLTPSEIAEDLTFTVKDSQGKEIGTYTVGNDFNKTAEGKYELTIKDVEVGTYTVEEKVVNKDGYTLTVTYSINGAASETGAISNVEVTADNTAMVAYKNEYKEIPPTTGTLKITKTIEGDLTPSEIAGDLTFTVKDSQGNKIGTYNVGNDFTKTAEGKYELTIKDVEVGTYTVEENVVNKDGYTLTVTYSINGAAFETGAISNVEVTADNTAMVAYKNEYKEILPTTGTLKITKTIEGDLTPEEAAGDLKFTVKNTVTGETKDYTINADFTKNTDGVYELVLTETAGTYEVTETVRNRDGYVLTSTYSVNGAGSEAGKVTDVTVTAGHESVVAYKNVYKAIDGTFSKQTLNPGNASYSELPGASMKLTSKDADLSSVTPKDATKTTAYKFDNTNGTITWTSGNEALVLTKLPVGSYKLEETAELKGYKVSSAIEFTVNDDGTMTLTSSSAGLEETFALSVPTQNYIVMFDAVIPTTDAKFSKVELGEGDAYKELSGASMKLTSSDADLSNVTTKNEADKTAYGFNNTNGTITWTSGSSPLELTKLPEGTYTLEETKAPGDGKYKVASKIKFTIDENGKITVDATSASCVSTDAQKDNNIVVMLDELNLGSTKLAFTKVDANDTNKAVKGAKFELYKDGVKIDSAESDKEGNVVFANKLTYSVANGETTTYTVKEISPADGYVLATGEITVSIDSTGKITMSGANVIADTMKVTNVPQTGTLKITKTIEGDLTPDEAKGDLTFTVKNTATGETKDYTIDADFTKNVDGVYELVLTETVGAYEVTESVKTREGYTLSVSYTVNGGTSTEGKISNVTVTADNESVVAYTNKYTEKPGTLKITKTIKGDLTPEEIEGALWFEVTEPDGVTTETYTIKDDFTRVSDGVYEKVITNVKPGDYTVKEFDETKDGYLVAVSYKINGGDAISGKNATVAVTAGNDSVVAYTNDYTAIDGTFSKQTLKPGDTSYSELPGASLQLTSSDADLSKVTAKNSSDVTEFDNTKGVITWKSGNKPLVLTKLPVGSYTLTETAKLDDYEISSDVTFTVNDDGTMTLTGEKAKLKETYELSNPEQNLIVMFDAVEKKPTEVEGTFSKQTLKPGDSSYSELPGASLKLTSSDADLSKVTAKNESDVTEFKNTDGVITWKSGDKPLVLTKLPVGSYTLTETAKLDDYEISSDVTFTVNDDGTMTLTGEKAKLKETYELSNPEQNLIVMFDAVEKKPTEVDGTFSKQTLKPGDSSYSELPGASLKLTSSDADLSKVTAKNESDVTEFKNTDGVITWKSGNEPLVLTKLPAGSYTLTETAKLDDYLISSDVTFTVNDDGTMTLTGEKAKLEETYKLSNPEQNLIVMFDAVDNKPVPTTDVTFSKKAIMGGSELVGAEITVEAQTDVKGYDADKIVSTSGHDITKDGRTVTWTSTDKPLVLAGLPDGTYVMTEIAAPSGYDIATVIEFQIVDGKVAKTANTDKKIQTSAIVAEPHNVITMIDDATTMVSFDKRSIKLAGDSLAGAKLQIHNADGVTKLTNVYSTNGESVLSDDELYISWTSTGDGTTPIQFWGLPNGLYVLEETEAPISSEYVYHKADPIAFRVENGIIKYQATERKDDGSVVYNEPDNWILVVDLGDPITPPGNPPENPPSNPPSNPPKKTPPSNPPKNDPPSEPPTPKDPPKNPPTPNPPANPPQVPPKTPGKKATVTINDNKTPLASDVTKAGDVNTGNLTGDEFANEGFVYAILSLIAAISLIGAALLGRKKED